MINIMSAIIIFFITVMIHELTHYIFAKYYGLKPFFTWVSTKDKKCTKITKFLPGVRFNDTFNYKQYRWISLSPFPVCILPFTLIFVVYFIPNYNPNIHWWFLPIAFIFGTLASYGGSMADINDVKKFKMKMTSSLNESI